VGEGMEQAHQFLRSIQRRARGGLPARSGSKRRRSSVVRGVERPLAGKSSVALQEVIRVSGVFHPG